MSSQLAGLIMIIIGLLTFLIGLIIALFALKGVGAGLAIFGNVLLFIGAFLLDNPEYKRTSKQ